MNTLAFVVLAATIVVCLVNAQNGKRSIVVGSGNNSIHVQPMNTTLGNQPRGFQLNRGSGNNSIHVQPMNTTVGIQPRGFQLNRYLRQSSKGTGLRVRRVKISEKDYVLPCGCRAMMDPGASLRIQTENFPAAYPKHMSCEWLIIGAELKTTCKAIRIQKSRSCKKDSLYLQYDTTTQDEYLNVCGNRKNFNLKAEDYIYAKFTTDGSRSRKGFSCRITAAAEPATAETTPSAVPSSEKCHCGKINNVARIVGGEATTPNKFPWQASLVSYGGKKPFCGGAIINDNYILTASHCADIMDTTNQVLVGDHSWRQKENTTQRFDIEKIIMHEKYDPDTVDNDIALLKLKSPISFPEDNLIAPVCLPPANQLFENMKAIVSGWGALYSDGPQPDILQEVAVTTITNKECASKYAKAHLKIYDNMLCAEQPGKDSCQGDSGGPLVGLFNASQSTYQLGIVSWGIGCADDAFPGVYARVNSFQAWLRKHTKDSKTCEPIQ